MAPKGSKGKSTDLSTEWSAYEWDKRGFYHRSRLNRYGEIEYDYPPSEATQDPQNQQNTPRFPGPNALDNNNVPYPTSVSSADTSYGFGNSDYTTSNDAFREYGYNTAESSGTSRPVQDINESASSDNESVLTVRYAPIDNPSYVTNPSYSSVSPAYKNTTNTEAVAQSLQNMTIAGSSTETPQAYANTQLQSAPSVYPNNENYGRLDPRYKVQEDTKRMKFWKVGRVFMVLWTEPAGQYTINPKGSPSTTGSQLNKFSKTYLEGTAFSEIRRFVVVVEGHGNSICSPIHTYNGQATLKYNLPEPSSHAIIYTTKYPPAEHWYKAENGTIVQENLTKDPIKVLREQNGPEGELDPLSRINYSKIYTVEKNVRVLNIGMVADESMLSLIHNCFVKPRDTPIEKPKIHPRRTNSHQDDNKSKGKGKERDSGKKRR